MIDVKVGDTVIVYERLNRGHSEQQGIVTKVARVWITVDTGRERRFRRDTQMDGAEIGYPAQFFTPAQWVEKQQADEADAYLREQGIEVGWTSPWRGREIELANLIRSAEES